MSRMKLRSFLSSTQVRTELQNFILFRAIVNAFPMRPAAAAAPATVLIAFVPRQDGAVEVQFNDGWAVADADAEARWKDDLLLYEALRVVVPARRDEKFVAKIRLEPQAAAAGAPASLRFDKCRGLVDDI